MKRFIYIICMAIGLMSCEDFLDKTDPTATRFDEFFNTEEDFDRVIYSSYLDAFTHQSSGRLLFYTLDARSDNAYGTVEKDYHQLIANGKYNSSSVAFEYYYNTHMKHLGRLNTFIASAHLPYVESEELRGYYIGVMEALRYWHYFILTSRWANVPFHLKQADASSALQAPKSKKEILDIMFGNYEKIADKLPKEEWAPYKHRFNHYSFKALVMRYALYDGRYELAAKIAKEIIDSKKYSLHPVYGDLFNYNACSNNNEFMMHLDLTSNKSVSWSNHFFGPHYAAGNGSSKIVPLKSLVDSYWTLQGVSIDKCPLHTKEEYELNPHLNRDPRFDASIYCPGDQFRDKILNPYDPSSTFYHLKERGSRSGFWFKKMVDEDDATKREGKLEYAFLRYAEVLLTYAEAKIMLNQVDALTKKCINDVRRRAGLDMSMADVTDKSYSQAEWISLIRNERRVELAGEGVRYDDIIRWKIAEDVLNKPALGHTRMIDGEKQSIIIEERTFKPHNYLWPFHESSLKLEPNLKQNPGY